MSESIFGLHIPYAVYVLTCKKNTIFPVNPLGYLFKISHFSLIPLLLNARNPIIFAVISHLHIAMVLHGRYVWKSDYVKKM